MDLTTILGMIAGLCAVAWSITLTGSLVQFADLPSVGITVGGCVCSVVAAYPLEDLMTMVQVSMKCFFIKRPQITETIATLVSFAERARREGILALERHIDEIDTPAADAGVSEKTNVRSCFCRVALDAAMHPG